MVYSESIRFNEIEINRVGSRIDISHVGNVDNFSLNQGFSELSEELGKKYAGVREYASFLEEVQTLWIEHNKSKFDNLDLWFVSGGLAAVLWKGLEIGAERVFATYGHTHMDALAKTGAAAFWLCLAVTAARTAATLPAYIRLSNFNQDQQPKSTAESVG